MASLHSLLPLRFRRAERTAGALVALIVFGCHARPSRTTESHENRPAEQQIDELRSLGYLGGIPASLDRPGEGLLSASSGSVAPGYRFYTAPTACAAALVDEEGRLRASWFGSPCDRWSHVELVAGGDLLVVGTDPGPEDSEGLAARRFIMRLSWSGDVLWKRPYPAHHDARLLPSGQILTLKAAPVSPPPSGEFPWRDNQVVMLDGKGMEVEARSLYAMFQAPGGPQLVITKPNLLGEVDLFHANTAQWVDPHSVLVTVRHQDLVLLADWRTGRVLWSWGPGEISGPHDATLLPNGNVVLFDNGLARGWSRLIELSPTSGKIVWSYQAPKAFFSASRGSVQRLSNGNTLVAESDKGRIFEVTPSGKVVWDYLCPFRDAEGRRATIMRARLHERAVIAPLLKRGEGTRNVRSEAIH